MAGDFFHTSGSLSDDAPSYIERPADEQLVALVQQREFTLILAPRQTGKSSLMVHALTRLREQGAQVGWADLQPLGATRDPDQWFKDVLYQLERSFGLQQDTTIWWDAFDRRSPETNDAHGNAGNTAASSPTTSTSTARRGPGPTQRFLTFFEDVLLRELPEGHVVVFIDEIDSALNLPFSDDFFTSIRSLYNARALTPELRRLTFVLLGVASPTAFIRDRERTPFNIGAPLPLTDFDRSSLDKFQEALGAGSTALVDRIFYWTNGQPLLVQRLAAAAYSWPPEERTPERMDAEVQRMFFGVRMEQDTHLQSIENYLLDPKTNVRDTLGVYQQVLEGAVISERADSAAHDRLKLAGVVRIEEDFPDVLAPLEGLASIGSFRSSAAEDTPALAACARRLAPRNRIYKTVFGPEWVRRHTKIEAFQVALTQWLQSGKREDYVLRGQPLAQARAWIDGRSDVTPDEQAFVLAGIDQERREEKRRLRRASLFATGLAILSGILFLSVMTIYAAKQSEQAARLKAEKSAASEKQARTAADASAIQATRLAASERSAKVAAERSEGKEKQARLQAMQFAASEKSARAKAEKLQKQAILLAERADKSRLLAEKARQQADAARENARRLSYVATMNLIQREGDNNNYGRVAALLGEAASFPDRSFEYDYWYEQAQQNSLPPKRHNDKMLTVRFLGNGQRIMTASDDGVVKIWDANSGKDLLTFRVADGNLADVVVMPGGKEILSLQSDYNRQGVTLMPKLWSTEQRKAPLVLDQAPADMQGVAFLPQGQHFLTIAGHNSVAICSVKDHGKVATQFPLDVKDAGVWALSPDGALLLVQDRVSSPQARAIGASSGSSVAPSDAVVWSVSRGKRLLPLSLPKPTGASQSGYPVGALAAATFSPDSHLIATADANRRVTVWSAQTGMELRSFSFPASVTSLAFSPDGMKLAVAGGNAMESGAAVVYEAPTGREILALKGHTQSVDAVCFSTDSSRVATASDDHTARIWSLPKTAQGDDPLSDSAVQVSPSATNALAWSPDGHYLAMGADYQRTSRSPTRALPERIRGFLVRNLSQRHLIFPKGSVSEPIYSVAFSPTGHMLATGGSNGAVNLWSMPSLVLVRTLPGPLGEIDSVAWSHDGKFLTAGNWDGSARIWNVNTGGIVRTLPSMGTAVLTITWSPEGRRVVTGGWDGVVRIWNVTTGQLERQFSRDLLPINAAAWSRDGRLIATGGGNRTITLWDAHTGQPKQALSGHKGVINALAFTPDDRRVVSASGDGTVKFWEWQTGKEVLNLDVSSDPLTALALAPNGRQLMVGTRQGGLTSFNPVRSGLPATDSRQNLPSPAHKPSVRPPRERTAGEKKA